jgi:small GTP-binding protein
MTSPALPKVIMLGDTGVGKTALITRQSTNIFSWRLPPTIGNLQHKFAVRVGDRDVELQVWDTAGHEEYAPLVPMYARGAQAGIIVGSVVEPVSLESIRVWKGRLLETEPNALVVLAINKMDLATEAAVRTRIQNDFGEEFPHIIFTSARSGDGVKDLFAVVAEHVACPPSETGPTPQVDDDRGKCC